MIRLHNISWWIRAGNLSETFGPCREKTCLRRVANIKGADQPAQSDQRLFFFFCFLESITSKLATCEISSFLLVSVAEQAGLKLALSEAPKDRYSCDKAHLRASFAKSFAASGYLYKSNDLSTFPKIF